MLLKAYPAQVWYLSVASYAHVRVNGWVIRKRSGADFLSSAVDGTAKRDGRTLDRELPSRAPRTRRGPRRAASRPTRAVLHQLLPRGPLPLGTEQRHAKRESCHTTTVTHGESHRAAASGWTSSSLRVAGSRLVKGHACHPRGGIRNPARGRGLGDWWPDLKSRP